MGGIGGNKGGAQLRQRIMRLVGYTEAIVENTLASLHNAWCCASPSGRSGSGI